MAIIIKLLPFIIQGIQFAEEWFMEQPKSGSQKKEFVTTLAQTAISAWQSFSTGGQKITADELSGPIGQTIDIWSKVIFPK
jgi:hypothetical protein